MIKVRLFKDEKAKLNGFEVQGHAGYEDAGKDIVCAGVSAIIFGGMNAIAYYYHQDASKFQVELKEGYTYLKLTDKATAEVQTVLETIEIQLKTIEETYGQYIKIID